MNDILYKRLCEAVPADRVLINEPMKKHTTFRIGGPADYFVIPVSWEEVELVNAENRISAVNAGIYTPSVPVLLAGEWISRNHIKYIINTGSDTFGISGGKIKVVKNER